MKKDGAYNGEIQNSVNEIFESITPYVYHEPRWGFADSLVYIPQHIVHEKIKQEKESIEKTPLKICRFFNDDVCSLKSDKWDWKRKYDYMKRGEMKEKGKKNYDATIWTNRETGDVVVTNGWNSVSKLPKLKKKCLCNGKDCEHYLETLDTRIKAQRRFEKGIHLIEIKTDRDNVKRFSMQLPHYVLMGDFIWLVLESKKVPDWVPSFVGIMRYEKQTLFIEKKATKIDRFPYLNQKCIKKADKNIENFAQCSSLFKFIQDWFINSVFQWKYDGENIVDMSYVPKLIRLKKEVEAEKVKINNKTLNEYL